MWYDMMKAVLFMGECEYSPLEPVPLSLGAAIEDFNRRKADDNSRDHEEENLARIPVHAQDEHSPSVQVE